MMFQQTFFENNGIIFHPEIGNICVPLARMWVLDSRAGVPWGPGEGVTSPGGGGPALPRVHTVQGEHGQAMGHLWVTPRPSPGPRHQPLGGDHDPWVTGGHMMSLSIGYH